MSVGGLEELDIAKIFRPAGLTIAIDGSQDGELSGVLKSYWGKEWAPRWREEYLARSRDGGYTAHIVSELEMRHYKDDGPPEGECFSGGGEGERLLSLV